MAADLSMSRMLDAVRAGRAAVWVRVEQAGGSAPREAGASMLVGAGFVDGTIGGGHLEYQAIATARAALQRTAGAAAAHPARAFVREMALGPSLGQCCGGRIALSFRVADAAESGWIEALARAERDGATLDLATSLAPGCVPHSRVATAVGAGAGARASVDAWPGAGGASTIVSRLAFRPWHVWVFGAGHVGEALVRILATLPARVVWIDPRESQFPAALPGGIVASASDSPAHEVASIPPGADVVVMTHSHALDFDVCAALLARDDLGWCGVIGSRTKAARFARRLAQRGMAPARIARLHCPIGASMPAGAGAPRIADDKHPGAIALDVASELWQRRRHALQAAVAPAGDPATHRPDVE